MTEKPTLYICDAEKNTECPKTCCVINGGLCNCTSKPEFAALDENGQPITEKNDDQPF